MQSDPMWSLAMAVNVYLVFFRRYDASRLKKLYWIYGLLCYGLPFIPALVCLLVRKKNKGKIYGNATVIVIAPFPLKLAKTVKLWCWIDNEWAPLRIYSYYAPIWIAILLALIIYIRVGIEIFQKRSQLRAAAHGDGSGTYTNVSTSRPEPFTGLRTTEVDITRDPWSSEIISPTAPATAYSRGERSHKENYSITISAPHTAPAPARILIKRPHSMDKVKWAYTKVSVLFAVSILITWVPASANRVYGLRYPNNPSYALNIGSAIVLPLQGFWNTVIFFTTSLGICRTVWARFKARKEEGFMRLEFVHLASRKEKKVGSESMVELSSSRSLASRNESF